MSFKGSALSNIVYCVVCAVLTSGCQTISDSMEKVVDLNTTQKQKTVLHPIVSKLTTKGINEGMRKINRMTPIFVGDSVIVGNGVSGVSRISKYGQTEWFTEFRNGVEASSAIRGNLLYVPANDGYIYKVDASNGQILDQVRTGSENLGDLNLSPDGKVLFAQNSVGTVFAINADSLKVIWSYTRVDSQPSTIRGSSKVVWAANKVFAGTADGSIVALNADTGAVVWEKLLNNNKKFRDIDANPLVDNNKIYISAYDSKTYCLDLNGLVLWQANYGGFGSPSISGETLFIPTSDNQMVALDKATGVLKWTFPTKGVPTELKTVKGYGVFGSSSGPLYLVDIRQGKEVAHFTPGRGIMSAPAVANENSDVVAFISGEAVLYMTKVQRERRE